MGRMRLTSRVSALLLVLLTGCAGSTPLDQGNARYKAGDFRAAAEAYTEAIQADPTARAYASRGNALMQLGDFRAAVADYTRAIELSAGGPEIYVDRGNAHLARGNFSSAVADYTRALELDADNARAAYNRGVARERHGDLAAALVDYRRAFELEPDSGVKAEIREVMGRLGGDPSPIGAARGADRSEPGTRRPASPPRSPTAEDDPHALASRALTRELRGDHDGALEDLRKALRLEADPARRAELRHFLKFLEQSR